MAIKRSTKVISDISMSSMTDIVFLLLIFFLVTSTLVNPNALKLLLPKSTGQVSAKATVSVSIKDWGNDTYTYHINGSEVLVGSAGFMNLMGIRLPPNLELRSAVFSARARKCPSRKKPSAANSEKWAAFRTTCMVFSKRSACSSAPSSS